MILDLIEEALFLEASLDLEAVEEMKAKSGQSIWDQMTMIEEIWGWRGLSLMFEEVEMNMHRRDYLHEDWAQSNLHEEITD